VKVVKPDFSGKGGSGNNVNSGAAPSKNTKRELLKDYLFRHSNNGHISETSLDNWVDSLENDRNKIKKTMKMVKNTIKDMVDPKGTWEALLVSNREDEKRTKMCVKIVECLDRNLRGMEGKKALMPGVKSKHELTASAIGGRITKVESKAKARAQAETNKLTDHQGFGKGGGGK
jgi:hypothetical protein